MMLTMHGLPSNAKYNEIKTLIKEKCNLSDLILGTLSMDGARTKKVRIGVASDSEGDIIMKYLDGYRYFGQVLTIVPIGKSANETPQVNTSHDTSYQWQCNQPEMNYVNPMNPGQSAWPVQANQQWPNQQIPQQGPVQNNFEYVQPMVEQQNFYQQPPRGNLPRPHASHQLAPGNVNVMRTDQQNRQMIQGGRYQGYNPEKPQSMTKHGFQGPSHVSPQPTQSAPEHWASQGAQDNSRFQKSNKIMQLDKRQFVTHNQERNIEPQYEKSGMRFSPPRDQKESGHGRRVSPPGHRISPNGHRILPSGRRISPTRKTSQFMDRISPSGRRDSPSNGRFSPSGGRISPSGRRISPSGRRNLQLTSQKLAGRRISPSGRRFSPFVRQMSPTGRQNTLSGSQNLQHGRRISPPGHRFAPPGRHFTPIDRQNLQSGRRISPPERQTASSGRPISPSGRRFSPSRRRFSPSGRQFSPSGRRISPMGRRNSPSGRIISAERSFVPPSRRTSPGRGVSPGRRMSPGRRTSPERRVSPGHRIATMNTGPQGDRHMPQGMLPGKPVMGRKMSPGRHTSPNLGPPSRPFDRYSPSRKPIDDKRSGPKEVRPTYQVMTQAQNQPMYSGAYTPDNWQERDNPYQPLTKPVEDRRDISGVQKYDSRRVGDYPRQGLNQPDKPVSPSRMSRSPNRRDRSPIRDRYRRHSPSPRSPRRSWALEKRRSPDYIEPPPPPTWPELQENIYNLNQHEERNVQKPVWKNPVAGQKQEANTFFRNEEHRGYDREDRKYFGSPSRTQWENSKQSVELRDRSPLRSRPADQYSPIQNKLSPEDYDIKRHNEFQQTPRYQEPRVERYQKKENIKEDFDEFRPKQFRNKREYYREGFDNREDLHKEQENLDIEIKDVYKRASELTRKTEEFQRDRHSKKMLSDDHDQHDPEVDDLKKLREVLSRRQFYEDPHGKLDKKLMQINLSGSVDLSPAVQYKRDKAVDDLTGKVLLRFAPRITGKVRGEVEEQLKISIEDMIFEMFGDKDVSFIEIVIKFEERYGDKGMEKIFDNVISKFPIRVRLMKQIAPDKTTSSVKSATTVKMRDNEIPEDTNISDRNISDTVPAGEEFDQASVMAPIPLVPIMFPMVMAPVEATSNAQEECTQEGYSLYLCKDNLEAFHEKQAQYLKEFIVKSIIEASETSNDGWTPDLTLKGVQNETQYVVWTLDELSMNWLLKLNFSKFGYFNIIIYKSKDFENERAAIWLPGHSKTRSITPLKKLIMQNGHLDNVNIQTWKVVREIAIEKGTRLYVDMPPSSALALEKHNMTLSYELQKVQVFLRSVAIDKDAFDAGLEEWSIGSAYLYQNNAPMPSIDAEAPNVIKLCLDNTTVSVSTARKLKEELILQIFKHIKDGGKNRMDFLKYGYCKPGYFCVIPENTETAKWVQSMRMRKFNDHMITVLDAEKVRVKYITMTCMLPFEQTLTPKRVIEKFKMCNRGVKGLKFNLWMNGQVFATKNNSKMCYRVDVDLESVDSLIKIKFNLYYSQDNRQNETVTIKSHHNISILKDMIKRFKEETTDTLNVINMDISSEEEQQDSVEDEVEDEVADDDVICLD